MLKMNSGLLIRWSPHVLIISYVMNASPYMERRFQNFKEFIRLNGGVNAVAKKLGHANSSHLSQMVGPKRNRPITEKTVRKVEAIYSLPIGYFDKNEGVSAVEVKAELRDVAECLKKHSVNLSPLSFVDLVDFVEQAEGNAEFVDSLIRILKLAQKDALSLVAAESI